MKRTMALLVGGLLILGSVGCGSEERLTKAQFLRRLNAICKDEDKKTAFLDEENIFNLKTGAKAFGRATAIFGATTDKIEKLNPPEDGQELADRYVSNSRRVLEGLEENLAAASAGDSRTYYTGLVETIYAGEKLDRSLADYGAKDCFSEEEAAPPAETKPAEGATQVGVKASEYTFDIAPVKAGKTAFVVSNAGGEIHIFGFGRLKAGATFEQVKRAIETMPEEDPMLFEEGSEQVSGLAAPGGRVVLNADAKPGSYVAFCFISDPKGVPHLNKGMLVPFDVR